MYQDRPRVDFITVAGDLAGCRLFIWFLHPTGLRLRISPLPQLQCSGFEQLMPRLRPDSLLHPPSVWEFAHEVVTDHIAAVGKLWRTLALLALQLGKLTVEYLAGRRQRYIIPLRLYLTASVLFFAVAQGSAWYEDRRPSAKAAEISLRVISETRFSFASRITCAGCKRSRRHGRRCGEKVASVHRRNI
jgi:hypothetical protein